MNSQEIRKSFLSFFKKHGHAVVPSSSLIPEDPSVLLTSAGMQQFKKYFTGELDSEADFGSLSTVSIQKCFRTSDIDEVGDTTHLTFFEMLGNFSFGDYFKEEAIRWGYQYLTEILSISPERIHVTVFSGHKTMLKDDESFMLWHKNIGLPIEKIKIAGIADNFWGPTGNGGPCGPTTEIYVDGLEVWNIVFNEYYCQGSRDELLAGTAKLDRLQKSGIDTGMGLERLTAVLQGANDVFETDLLKPLISKIITLALALDKKVLRILADHLRSASFLIADGVRPSNKEAGYILRRLLRRILVYKIIHDIHGDIFSEALPILKDIYGSVYPEFLNFKNIYEVMKMEEEKYQKALVQGLREIKKYKTITAQDAFNIYQTFGLPFELIGELAPEKIQGVSMKEFEEAFKKHQDISRAGVEKKFGGHGLVLNTGELKAGSEEELKKVTRLHTATHLLHKALREVLGGEVGQMGSDITIERTRFDFTFPRKLTPDEIEKVEAIVNSKIGEDLPVGFVELSKDEAEKTGALHFFKEKYPDRVKVYYVGHDLKKAFSKEFCGGPHVNHTGEIGKFKVAKEEAVGAGVRRIRGIVM